MFYQADNVAAGEKGGLIPCTLAQAAAEKTGVQGLLRDVTFAAHTDGLEIKRIPFAKHLHRRAGREIRSSKMRSAAPASPKRTKSSALVFGILIPQMKVQVKNLRKEFGKTVAVDNISFSFDSGHVFGFVGPNGAGKTTTMRIISTIEEPTAGDVLLNGVSVCEEPELARRAVGYVPDTLPAHAGHHRPRVPGFLRARLRLARQETRRRPSRPSRNSPTSTGIREKHLKALSKGMKQRVSLGRALVYDPDVLVLDEPAAGLDPRARVELRELLMLLAERKKAILISSHILTELTEICNGVVIIERGKILETGTIDDVLKKSAPRRTVAIRLLEGNSHQNPQLHQGTAANAVCRKRARGGE